MAAMTDRFGGWLPASADEVGGAAVGQIERHGEQMLAVLDEDLGWFRAEASAP